MLKKLRYLCFICLVLALVSCSAMGNYYYDSSMMPEMEENTEEYNEINERGFVSPLTNPRSNFSLDSSSYAYTNLRRLIENNEYISKDAVVIEQMLNYFNYSYKNETSEALSSTIEIADCPWNSEHNLALISVNATELVMENTKNNFVFLIDVSGSMESSNKLGLVQESFKLLLESVGEDDTISIVTYASSDRVVLDGVKGSEKLQIRNAIEELTAGGSTNGSGGIQKAYELAEKHFIKGGNNRVLLATDGDFNVGISSQALLNEFISLKRLSGVYLTVLGFGMGNTKHNTMETLASKGNGNAYYIDSILEAKKVFVSELGSVLNTVAKDSKIQVEFNPDVVNKYRLLGYENKMMSDAEFEDSNTDAGEIGAGHTTIAIYEIELKDVSSFDYILKTTLRYKDPSTNIDKEVVNVAKELSVASEDYKFAACVAEFGLILRNSNYKGEATYEHLLYVLSTLDLNDEYRIEFKELVTHAYSNYKLNPELYE